ncbi:T9SS type B sorting domain-containing protein [Seonamhaeicola sp. MEBiC1930]|uniref:T9SS type B sorting domain-containing protein n=1 Tax=Seonamhaeicola sp. MEBiC01930 TaxID=2976768 RepID=UPI00324F7C5E
MKKISLFILLCILGLYTHAQRQASNWYFGYGAGVEFNLANNSVTSVDNGQLFTNEGCSSISDELGNLLFYTDGTTVWNRNHEQMLNGNNLFGDSSSAQSAIIVPKPDDENVYYIFTVDTTTRAEEPNYGFNYSIVNMTLDGGLGGIILKNSNLLPFCSEKLTAVQKDCVTKSIWVITFASENGDEGEFNTFHAFEITDTGVNLNAVKSTLPFFIQDKRGYLKVSPDGSKMALANSRNGLFLFDFDVLTGQASNSLELTISDFRSGFPYGIEFSPNNELLYVHSSNDFFDQTDPSNNNIPSNHSSLLVQFNLSVPNIQASEFIVDDRSLYRGALQLGPNGKIYRALSATYGQGLPYLGVINNPNNVGVSCNYQHNAVSLSPKNSSQGLPPFIASFFNQEIDIIKNGESATTLELCEGDSYTLSATELPGATYTWTLDEILLPESDYDLTVTNSGYYEVYIDPNNGDCAIEGDAFVIFEPNPSPINHTIIQCDEDGFKDGFTIFNLNEANNALTGNNDELSTVFYSDSARIMEIDGNSFLNTSNPQTIYVELINTRTGCFNYSELVLNVSLTDSNDVELEVCDDDSIEDGLYEFNLTDIESEIINGLPTGLEVSYYETYENALLENNSLENSYTNTTAYNQTIYARVENANNCYGISEISLIVHKLPEIITEDITYYCTNIFPDSISIDALSSNETSTDYTYSWSTGENTFSININEAKDYIVTVTNSNMCSKSRTIKVEASSIASINKIEVNDANVNNIITVLAFGDGEYQYRLLDENNVIYKDYQDSNVFENVFPGIYTVTVKDFKNNCGIVNDKVSVIGFPKFFSPNNDGKHDTWQVYGVSSMFQPNTKIRIFDRYGKLLKELSPSSEGWDGSFKGQKLPADDYWFTVVLDDGRIFKDHFTLKI